MVREKVTYFCLHSILTVCENRGDIASVSTEDFCLYVLWKIEEFTKQVDQEIRKGFLLSFLIESAWNQQENIPGAPQRTSVCIGYLYSCIEPVRKFTRSSKEDFCLYSLLKKGLVKKWSSSSYIPGSKFENSRVWSLFLLLAWLQAASGASNACVFKSFQFS